jgi:hypothetical protein
MYPKPNEWNLLKQQFDALADEESANADSIEEIFDMEFRRRFGELINQTREPSTQNRDIAFRPFHRGHFRRFEKDLKDEPARPKTFGQATVGS